MFWIKFRSFWYGFFHPWIIFSPEDILAYAELKADEYLKKRRGK